MKTLKAPSDILRYGMALQHYATYMQDIGEKPGAGHRKAYGGKYIVVIRQTKTQIVIEIK